MVFKIVFVNKEERFSLGIEEDSGKFYLAIPVSNNLVNYDEYYWIDDKSFQLYQINQAAALKFVRLCRDHKVDNLLIMKPGSDRGVPM
jgi:hypothetical protein